MSKFALGRMEGIVGKISFFKLFIDNNCPFDDFEQEILADGNMTKQLPGIYAIMDQVANLQLMPLTKFRHNTKRRISKGI